MSTYVVRQYRPNYFTGFVDQIARGVEYDGITAVPWAENFKHSNFERFSVEPYPSGELIITAHYADGKQWVVGFAAEEGSKLSKDWRYQEEPRHV